MTQSPEDVLYEALLSTMAQGSFRGTHILSTSAGDYTSSSTTFVVDFSKHVAGLRTSISLSGLGEDQGTVEVTSRALFAAGSLFQPERDGFELLEEQLAASANQTSPDPSVRTQPWLHLGEHPFVQSSVACVLYLYGIMEAVKVSETPGVDGEYGARIDLGMAFMNAPEPLGDQLREAIERTHPDLMHAPLEGTVVVDRGMISEVSWQLPEVQIAPEVTDLSTAQIATAGYGEGLLQAAPQQAGSAPGQALKVSEWLRMKPTLGHAVEVPQVVTQEFFDRFMLTF